MNLPLSKFDEPSGANLRAVTRTHLFVVAVLYAETAQMPVTIRNLSAAGALIEASALPVVGAVVQIRRASLSVEGVVAWRSKNQAGIAFSSTIFVPAWLPRQSGLRQSSIDRMVFNLKNGSDAVNEPRRELSAHSDADPAIAELSAVRSDLISLGDAIVQDIALVAQYPEIQLLDIAIQRIDRLLSRATKAELSR